MSTQQAERRKETKNKNKNHGVPEDSTNHHADRPFAWKGEWKKVYKKDDQLDERNYRPTILLSTADKVYKSMMSIQVNNHLDSKLGPCLSMYRKKHSCEITLLRLTEDLKLAVDSKQLIGILSTDMSKPFDSLHPSLMINKLKLDVIIFFQPTKQSQTQWSNYVAVGRML